jgi:glycosyltransferase involved in cell wall biosynthesis
MKLRIAIVVSHPIQHFCPQYVSLAQHPELECRVFFASALGYKKYVDADFKQEISWGNLALDKFSHEFLNGEEVLQVTRQLDAPSLDSALERFNPGVVITYGYFQQLQRRAYRWAGRHNIPLAYISDSERRQHRNPLKELIKYPYLRWYFSKIRFFLTVGNANEAFYTHFGIAPARFIRMHFPIDLHSYRASFSNREALNNKIRQQYQINDGELVISVVGKLVPWKNQDHLIDALAVLEKKGHRLHLFMLGSGPQIDAWKQKAAVLQHSRVYFPGFVGIDELPAYYAATDIYVHPASAEPHSIAVSEAIFMGCPVIISNRCGSYGESDDVQQGKNGFVYPFGDINALADKIEWMISHPAERKAFGITSHEISLQFQQRSHVLFADELINQLKQ